MISKPTSDSFGEKDLLEEDNYILFINLFSDLKNTRFQEKICSNKVWGSCCNETIIILLIIWSIMFLMFWH